ncbi:hypothetical protein RJ640_010629 [Escallonia rubra]|uniref:MADS-box domain-containing protein n=1 Tax=Escallonia rubra TaxID=112253 RepID=A0AA88RFC0_9ASTE|nr:hypothetical protein RJ640_010629 [Escallonia rubra]
MGRVKLKMQTLESTGNRQVTYSKRRSGIIKKARELSILCGIDIILLMFGPNGRPTLFSGVHSKVDEVITKFAQLSPYERLKRKMESLEGLKKTFQKLDHDVELQDFMGARNVWWHSCASALGLEDDCEDNIYRGTPNRDVQFGRKGVLPKGLRRCTAKKAALEVCSGSVVEHEDTIEGNEMFFAEAVTEIKEGMKEVMMSRDACEGDNMVFAKAVTEILKKPPILAIV